MPPVKLIDPVTDPRWDDFVIGHPFGWICHLSGWKRILEKCFPHMKGYCYVLLDEGEKTINAALPLFHVRSWLAGNRLVSIPFATLSDPLVSSDEELHILMERTLKLYRELGCSYIEIRTLATSDLIETELLGKLNHYKHHYLLLQKEPEKLKQKFHRSCVRQKISRAIKSDVTSRIGQTEMDLKIFYGLYLKSRKRLGLPPQPYNFFKGLWDIFLPEKQLQLMLAEVKGRSIGGLILFKFKNRVSAEFSVNDKNYIEMSPNHLLFWEAIKMSYEQGFEIFDFGRTSIRNEGLLDFKRRWNTIQVDLPNYIYPKESTRRLGEVETSIKYKMISKVCRNMPESFLKQIGNFCYRHLG